MYPLYTQKYNAKEYSEGGKKVYFTCMQNIKKKISGKRLQKKKASLVGIKLVWNKGGKVRKKWNMKSKSNTCLEADTDATEVKLNYTMLAI